MPLKIWNSSYRTYIYKHFFSITGPLSRYLHTSEFDILKCIQMIYKSYMHISWYTTYMCLFERHAETAFDYYRAFHSGYFGGHSRTLEHSSSPLPPGTRSNINGRCGYQRSGVRAPVVDSHESVRLSWTSSSECLVVPLLIIRVPCCATVRIPIRIFLRTSFISTCLAVQLKIWLVIRVACCAAFIPSRAECPVVSLWSVSTTVCWQPSDTRRRLRLSLVRRTCYNTVTWAQPSGRGYSRYWMCPFRSCDILYLLFELLLYFFILFYKYYYISYNIL